MRRFYTAFLAIGLLALSACAGQTARENVLLPALQRAWVGVSDDVDRGVTAAESASEIDAAQAASLRASSESFAIALKSVDTTIAALPLWKGQLEPMALRGIKARVDEGELAPPLDDILKLRVEKFSEALEALEALEVLRGGS